MTWKAWVDGQDSAARVIDTSGGNYNAARVAVKYVSDYVLPMYESLHKPQSVSVVVRNGRMRTRFRVHIDQKPVIGAVSLVLDQT